MGGEEKSVKLFHPDIYCLQYVSEKVAEILDQFYCHTFFLWTMAYLLGSQIFPYVFAIPYFSFLVTHTPSLALTPSVSILAIFLFIFDFCAHSVLAQQKCWPYFIQSYTCTQSISTTWNCSCFFQLFPFCLIYQRIESSVWLYMV